MCVYLGYSVPLPWCTKVVYGVRYPLSKSAKPWYFSSVTVLLSSSEGAQPKGIVLVESSDIFTHTHTVCIPKRIRKKKACAPEHLIPEEAKSTFSGSVSNFRYCRPSATKRSSARNTSRPETETGK